MSAAVDSKRDVPAFITKLLTMLEDATIQHLISWGPTGNTFIVHDSATLAADVLPKYYKHHNFTSLVRQLNMYGFHKVVGVEQGGLESHADNEWEFIHPSFKKGRADLLRNVRRKEGSSSSKKTMMKQDLDNVMRDLTAIKGQHSLIESKFQEMAMQNQQLWNEVVHLRQQHQEYSWKLGNILNFLARMVQPPEMPSSNKRRRLALEETASAIEELLPNQDGIGVAGDSMPPTSGVATTASPPSAAAAVPAFAAPASATAQSAVSSANIPPPTTRLMRLASTDENAHHVMGDEVTALGSRIEETRQRLEEQGMNPGVLASILGTPPGDDGDSDFLPSLDGPSSEPVPAASGGGLKRKAPRPFDLPVHHKTGGPLLYSPLTHFLEDPFRDDLIPDMDVALPSIPDSKPRALPALPVEESEAK